jgi:predicted small metal-binding protein
LIAANNVVGSESIDHKPSRKTWRLEFMKTMTCRQLGGPCDAELRGDKADDVIKAQDQHLKSAVESGDTTHEAALKEMQGRWKRPIAGMGWYRKTKKAFADLPEN